jgi:quinoprotein glucose dehydrogenase
LVDIVVNGRAVKAVAQVTKQNFLFVFDRVTGEPVWPIEDQPVPRSSVKGERASATQPFPTRPPPLDIQGISEEDLIDFTPEVRAEALEILRRYDYGPLYTPPSERGTVTNPGIGGGANWPGAAVDPETGMLYVETHRIPYVIALRRPMPFEQEYDYIGSVRPLLGPSGLPILKSPFSSLVAIDMNTGEHRWRVPLGVGPAENSIVLSRGIKERLGNPYTRGWALVTKSLLLAVQSGVFGNPLPSSTGFGRTYSLTEHDTNLWAYDKATGELLADSGGAQRQWSTNDIPTLRQAVHRVCCRRRQERSRGTDRRRPAGTSLKILQFSPSSEGVRAHHPVHPARAR